MAGHTLHDVAARAGVSKATASRVLNGNLRVDPDTRERVLDRHGGARLHAQRDGSTPELRSDPDHQCRHDVPDPTPGRRAPPRRRRGPQRQRVRPGHLQRRDHRQA